ncbi:MAG TPA: hypothetical protein VHC22_21325 [Pirellulales bacterium]|nr:hypothetical protein [Pirellulales bacterium]
MSADPNAAGPYEPQSPPPSSGGSKVWLYLGIGCVGMLVLCCGGGAIGFYFIGKSAFQITQVPADVLEQSAQIAEFDVPEGFEPQTAVTVKVPFTGQKFMTMVVYTPSDNQGGIFLMGMGQMAGNADPEVMKLQMEQQMKQQGQGQQTKQLTVLDTREVQVEIRGKPATFKIQKAEDPNSKQQFVQILGGFDGKEGPVMFFGQIKADDFSEEDAEAMVRSIK